MRRTWLTALALGTGLAMFATTATAAPTTPTLELPQPTGPLPIGHRQQHLVDHDRPDPWAPEQPRELMITLWYPTAQPTGEPAQYLTPAESREVLAHLEGVPEVPDDILSTVGTHAHTGAPLLAPRLPLVVLSPGFSHPRAALTGLGEDLASRGYAVALLSHNHESFATEFPDGHLTPCLACDPFDGQKVVRGRVADIRFLLDELPPHHTAAARAHRRGRPLDRRRQRRAHPARRPAHARRDQPRRHLLPRARPRPRHTLPARRRTPAPARWHRRVLGRTWSHLTDWRRWLTISGTSHSSFTDFSILSEQFGVGLPDEPLDGHRTATISREYVAAFLDEHRRGIPQPLLRGPSAHHPEVGFEDPAGS
ncbi:alpha/beta hydrolase [Saccharopolyspora rhizosphaerae]|nr:alpha/beta hydrolase [Saccharopolyspora rhizosphaerae]